MQRESEELSAYIHFIWASHDPFFFTGNMRPEVLCRLEGNLSSGPGCAPLNACLQTGPRESWAIKDRVGCGGHMNHLASLGLAGPSLQTERVWCVGPAIFFLSSPTQYLFQWSQQSRQWWVRQLIPGSYLLEQPDSFPMCWTYLGTWWLLRGLSGRARAALTHQDTQQLLHSGIDPHDSIQPLLINTWEEK